MDYVNFMKSTGYFGIIAFLLLIAVCIIIPIVSNYRMRERYSGGIQTKLGGIRRYKTPADEDHIIESLKEKTDGDVMVYSFEETPINDDGDRLVVFYKYNKPIKRMHEEKYLLKILKDASQLENVTVLEIRPADNKNSGVHEKYIDRFIVEKLNAVRIL